MCIRKFYCAHEGNAHLNPRGLRLSIPSRERARELERDARAEGLSDIHTKRSEDEALFYYPSPLTL